LSVYSQIIHTSRQRRIDFHMISVWCIVVLYFAYQCFFDDLLLCCETCAIDIGLLNTKLLSYMYRQNASLCQCLSSYHW